MVDPANAKIVAQHIANSFSQIDRKNAAAYQANLQKFTRELDTKLQEWEKALAPFKGQRLVAYHNSWPYFAHRFGFIIDLFLEPKPGLPPTPAHLAEVMTKMKEQNAHVILVDPYLNRKTADVVARATGATVLDVAQFPGGIKGTEGNYIKLMDAIVSSLAKALASK
jgi:zinc/manganese transport system substrate-binding protein